VPITLNRKPQLAADRRQLGERDVAQFWTSKPKITETEEKSLVELRQESGALGVGREEFDDGFEVECGLIVVDCGALGAAVGEEFFL